jgi:hypothetical protein
MSRFVLDPDGINSVESGFHFVNNEIDFLHGILDDKFLYVAGDRLCQWASEIAITRNYEVEWRKSPAKELAENTPSLSLSDAGDLLARLDINQLGRPITAIEVANKLWPDYQIWFTTPDIYHSFQWLSWYSEAQLSKPEENLLRYFVSLWQIESTVPMTKVYAVSSSDAAWKLLQGWIRVSKNDETWPSAPSGISPRLIERLVSEWRIELVRSQGEFFTNLLSLEPSNDLILVAARVTEDYYKSNKVSLNADKLIALKPYLSFESYDFLVSFLPIVDPGLSPDNFTDLLPWFKQSYLPYRIKSTIEHSVRLKEITRNFANWFLSFYANSRAGGDYAKHLSWCKAAKLSNFDGVTLMVVLDGLCYRDGELLLKYIKNASNRIEVDDLDVVIAPLPTITYFAKPALITGFKPSCALEEDRLGPVARRVPELVKALDDANSSDIVIWSVLEPDHIYHQQLDADSINREVTAWMQGFASSLAEVVRLVKDSKVMRIVVTTDHGRLLSSAQRIHQIPDGMEAHGRAAWGPSDVTIGEEGFVIKDDIAYLHPERYGLPQTCALVLDGNAFVASDGRGGRESFPHGGIYPEEVLIPWIQLSRDRGTVSINAKLSGTGVGGSTGEYVLEIINASPIRIEIREFIIPNININLPLRFSINPMDKTIKLISGVYWPTSNEVISLEAVITYSLPTGEMKHLSITPNLVIEEMYQQNDILRDL